ncbi:MAG: TetR/AcrR family transcriptional regulator [Myxococcota bacterium]|nr:TetR/AcrR family transcriptional regulator [Myxococcota bacterium]
MPTASKPRKAGRPSKPMTREELLTAATKAFAATGYRGTSLGVIADALGVRKASLFHHVKNKEMLYLEALSTILGGLANLVQEARLGEGDFGERLDRLGGLVVEFLGSEPCAAKLLYREMMDEGPFYQNGGKDQAFLTLNMLSEFFDGAMRAGEIPQQNPKQLAMSVVGAHLTWFAMDNLSEMLQGESVFSESAVTGRKLEIRNQLRRICGVAL